MERVILILNPRKEASVRLAGQAAEYFRQHGVTLLAPPGAFYFSLSELGEEEHAAILREAEAAIVFGGDGSLLSAARVLPLYQIPCLGINLGHLGFMTETEADRMLDDLALLLAGEYAIEERMMLSCRVQRGEETLSVMPALNDIVVTNGEFSRMIVLDVYVDGVFAIRYPADGLIISTPTGSTAYSMSAGGPLVSPEMELMLITPVCAHLLYARPLIVSAKQHIQIHFRSASGSGMLTADGQRSSMLAAGDTAEVSMLPQKTRLIRFRRRDFFSTLRSKLQESGE